MSYHVLNSSLRTNEHFLWTDRPASGLKLRPQDQIAIPASLVWMSMVLGIQYFLIMQPVIPLLALGLTIPFLLVGLYLLAGRFFFDKFVRDRVYYGITDHGRLIIKTWVWYPHTIYYNISDLPALRLQENNDGTGTITFFREEDYEKEAHQYVRGTYMDEIAYVLNVREVYHLLEDFRHEPAGEYVYA